ncbi:hypothetical protein EON66_06775 [archaeon]|nr:MAG: hypothetical protein EON66_06775 [archaeon]
MQPLNLQSGQRSTVSTSLCSQPSAAAAARGVVVLCELKREWRTIEVRVAPPQRCNGIVRGRRSRAGDLTVEVARPSSGGTWSAGAPPSVVAPPPSRTFSD